MTGIKYDLRTATCRCGAVRLDVRGEAILTGICYCTSCQAAGRQFKTLTAAPAILTEDGGTPSVLYRKDRVQCVQGGEHLREYRLTSGSPTRRMVATCCNTPMFLDFTKGFWLTIYQGRLSGDVPQPEMRVMTAERPKGVVLPDDLPDYAGRSGQFMWRLLREWVLMGFGRPKVEGIPPPNSDIAPERTIEQM